jgi:tetratricopeptide (TPR) repeat protein
MFSIKRLFAISQASHQSRWQHDIIALVRDYRIGLAFVCAIFVLHAGYFGTYIFDDGAITLSYARNFAEGHGLVLTPGGERVEGYSNWLWVMILAACYKLGMGPLGPVFILKFPALLCGAATLILLFFLPRVAYDEHDNDPLWLLAPLATTISTPFVLWAITGLENALYSFLILLSAYLYLAELRDNRRKPWSALALAGVALTRPEGIIYFGVMLIHRVICAVLRKHALTRRDLAWAAIVVVPFGAFMLWRYSYFGYWVPNTFYAKASERHLSDLWRYLLNPYDSGLAYLLDFLWQQSMVFFLPLMALAVLPRKDWVANLLFCGLLGATSLYVVYVGGDWWWEFRFISPLVPIIALLIVRGLQRVRVMLRREPIAFALLLGAALLLLLRPNVQASALRQSTPDRDMIGMWNIGERGMTFREYAEMADISNPTYLELDVGGTSYFSQLKIVDLGLLADVHLARFKYYAPFFKQYVFAEHRPHFVHTHGVFTRNSRITSYRELWESYIPIDYNPDQYGGSGDFVRKDLFVARDTSDIPNPLDLPLADLRLRGFATATELGFPGQKLSFSWHWQCPQRCAGDRSFLLELRGPHPQRSIVAEYAPVFGWYPTSRWGEQEIVRVTQDLVIPADAPAGTYQLFVGARADGAVSYQPLGAFVVDGAAARSLAEQYHAEYLALGEQARWEDALPKAELAAQLDPTNAALVEALAQARARRQDALLTAASQALEEARLAPAAEQLARAQAIQPLPESGEALRQRLSQAYFELGQRDYEQHRYQQAFESFRQALAVQPANVWARHRLEDSRLRLHYIDYYFDTGQYEQLHATFLEERQAGQVPADVESLEKLYLGLQELADKATLDELRRQIDAANTAAPSATGTVTQEIRYRMPEAGAVTLVWGVDGWHALPEAQRPAGTLVERGNMRTPMERRGDSFVATVQVPAGSTLDYGFLITQAADGSELKAWDAAGNDGFHVLALPGRVLSLDGDFSLRPYLAAAEAEPGHDARTAPAPAPGNGQLVTQQISYPMPEAGAVMLVWGLDGWQALPEAQRPAGTLVEHGVMRTPMERQGDSFVATVQVPAGSTLDYGFLIVETASGTGVEVWEGNGDQDYRIQALQDAAHVSTARTELARIAAALTMAEARYGTAALSLRLAMFLTLAAVGAWALISWRRSAARHPATKHESGHNGAF